MALKHHNQTSPMRTNHTRNYDKKSKEFVVSKTLVMFVALLFNIF